MLDKLGNLTNITIKRYDLCEDKFMFRAGAVVGRALDKLAGNLPIISPVVQKLAITIKDTYFYGANQFISRSFKSISALTTGFLKDQSVDLSAISPAKDAIKARDTYFYGAGSSHYSSGTIGGFLRGFLFGYNERICLLSSSGTSDGRYIDYSMRSKLLSAEVKFRDNCFCATKADKAPNNSSVRKALLVDAIWYRRVFKGMFYVLAPIGYVLTGGFLFGDETRAIFKLKGKK
jgi:hypothetical protein